MMTAFATVDAAVAAVKAGAYDYLAKPFEPDDLRLTIDRALERRSAQTPAPTRRKRPCSACRPRATCSATARRCVR
jgi:DNA-binding NtrC family response regulator